MNVRLYSVTATILCCIILDRMGSVVAVAAVAATAAVSAAGTDGSKLPALRRGEERPIPDVSFDSRLTRDARFQQLYNDITTMKVVELDKRVASALRIEPLIFIQSLLAIYVLLNHIVESLLPETIKRRIRTQNLLTEAALHGMELWSRLIVPMQLANRKALFSNVKFVSDARKDMLHVIRGREGQQLAYSLICLFCGIPVGCVLPLIIRDLPILLKAGGIVGMLCNPQLVSVKNKKRKDRSAFEQFYSIDDPGADRTGPTIIIHDATGKQNVGSSSSTQEEFDFRSSKNLRSVVDLTCESASLVVEAVILTTFLMQQLTDFRGANTGLPVVLRRIVCAALILRYFYVRGTTLGELVVSTLEGSITLVGLQSTLQGMAGPLLSAWNQYVNVNGGGGEGGGEGGHKGGAEGEHAGVKKRARGNTAKVVKTRKGAKGGKEGKGRKEGRDEEEVARVNSEREAFLREYGHKVVASDRVSEQVQPTTTDASATTDTSAIHTSAAGTSTTGAAADTAAGAVKQKQKQKSATKKAGKTKNIDKERSSSSRVQKKK